MTICRLLHIRLRLSAEQARVVCATVDVSELTNLHFASMGVCVISGTGTAYEVSAVIEHSYAQIDVSRCPATAYVDRLQIPTLPEQVRHVSNFLSVEGGEVERCKARAALEQILHACHLAGDEVLKAFYLLQAAKVHEPTT